MTLIYERVGKKQPRLKTRKQQSVKKNTGRETPVPVHVEPKAESWRINQDVQFQHLRSQNKTGRNLFYY